MSGDRQSVPVVLANGEAGFLMLENSGIQNEM
jgi:hypothetical protein